MMYKFYLPFLIAITLLALSSASHAAQLSSSVDRNQVSINETLTLTLKYTDTVSAKALDLSVLRNDFDIISNNPQTSNSVSIINGQTTQKSSTTWVVTLAPKRQGKLLIPTFKINNNSSQPITIKVTNTAVKPSQQAMIVTTTTDRSTAYIGQQVIIKVTLLAQSNISNLAGEPLTIDGATIELLGQHDIQQTHNGLIQQGAEWYYAVFPEKPGKLVIPAQTFTGIIGSQRSFFDRFGGRGQRVGARSNTLTIQINDNPETNGHDWFPANNVTIQSNWSGNTNQLRVGSPITRTITITAQGQRANVIPPLKINQQAGYKRYQDQPKLDNKPSTTELTGIRVESEAIVPSTVGEFILPKHQVTWWNNETQRWQHAILPAEKLIILPAENHTAIEPEADALQPINNQTTQQYTTIWKLLTLCLSLICVLQFYFLLTLKKLTNKTDQSTNTNDTIDEAARWQQLKKALRTNNLAQIRHCLLMWGKSMLPEQKLVTLQTLANQSQSTELKALLDNLDQQLYKGDNQLDIDQLNNAITQFKNELIQRHKTQHKHHTLSSLYPS